MYADFAEEFYGYSSCKGIKTETERFARQKRPIALKH
jgi:hypothetical protein